MQLQFSSTLEYQLEAVNTVVELFNSQPSLSSANLLEIVVGGADGLQLTETGLANRLMLSNEKLLDNCRSVQKANGLPQSLKLEILTLNNNETFNSFSNFTVEMETGTGKTYVYLRTIYELHKQYGFKKYVIVVPSVAIREGVLKNLQITHEHFQRLYNNEPCVFSVYESSKVNELRNFSLSNAIQR